MYASNRICLPVSVHPYTRMCQVVKMARKLPNCGHVFERTRTFRSARIASVLKSVRNCSSHTCIRPFASPSDVDTFLAAVTIFARDRHLHYCQQCRLLAGELDSMRARSRSHAHGVEHGRI